MITTNTDDIFQGAKLVRVILEHDGVSLGFPEKTIRILAEFALSTGGLVLARVQPGRKSGEIAKIWALVGRRVIRTDFDSHDALIEFDGNFLVTIGPSPHARGLILARNPKTGIDIYDEF